MKAFKWLSSITLGLLLLGVLVVKQQLEVPLHSPFEITVAPSDSLHKILSRLQHRKIISKQQQFLLIAYAKLQQKTLVQRGYYQIAENTSVFELLEKLNSGDIKLQEITLVEGKTFHQVLAHLYNQNDIDKVTDWQLDLQLIEGFTGDNLEGLIFPDTYTYYKGETVASIVERAFNQMVHVLNEEWQNRSENLPYKTPYEALIMASIIEKETGVHYERNEIAGVFVRRLNKGMKLQTDPTVIYGLGDDYNGNIKRSHLKQPSPYNTYMNFGLPPTPIALAGREAIHAALHPASGESLYFVAKGDGSHQFSNTLEEHQKAVRYYQIEKRRKNYRSAPLQQAP